MSRRFSPAAEHGLTPFASLRSFEMTGYQLFIVVIWRARSARHITLCPNSKPVISTENMQRSGMFEGEISRCIVKCVAGISLQL